MELTARNRSVIRRARPGDLLKFDRGAYFHWAVYIGDEEVVHLAGAESGCSRSCSSSSSSSCSSSGKNSNKAVVKKDKVLDVAGKSEIEIDNNKDRKYKPRSVRDIVREALSRIGEFGYNVFCNNCEHFASYCRYGVKWSEQADTVLQTTMILGVGVAVGALALEAVKSKKS
uniref:HRAS-like suppressor 3 isoform X1 n=1 Tax=Crassostrea virginica TaxID=6565 RepID=A0A8B8AN24_CRAVI|nr:HRAS-like suppressor 3 isoform X1 [Crassostrea virginica]